MSFPTLEDAGRYVEFYNPVTEIGIDLAEKWLIIDDSGRRLDLVIDNCEILRCGLESLDARQEDLLLLESARRLRPNGGVAILNRTWAATLASAISAVLAFGLVVAVVSAGYQTSVWLPILGAVFYVISTYLLFKWLTRKGN